MRTSRRLRLLRGVAAATVANVAALTSHVWGGGAMPGMLGIVVPWLLSFMMCTLLSGIPLSIIRLILSVAVSQALFHALFVLGAVAPSGGLAPHSHGPLVLPASGASVLVPQEPGMWIAHAGAAAITVLLLHRGEQLVRAVVRIAASIAGWLARTVIDGAVRPVPPSPRRWAVIPAPRRVEPGLTALRRRGPPSPVI